MNLGVINWHTIKLKNETMNTHTILKTIRKANLFVHKLLLGEGGGEYPTINILAAYINKKT